ncbi:MAG: hypothetical protein FWF82_03430 [Oscillospiraceae bacterium]|nr:hypothetical protein [Oscillospiraceae bacterium]
MKIQVLDDLQNELNRLFIAGSKFAHNDPRIAKLIPTLDKMGEKAPVMKKLSEQTDSLIRCADSQESSVLLSDACGLLYSVMYTQVNSDSCDSPKESQKEYTPVYADSFPDTPLSYSALSGVREALTSGKSGRLAVIERAYENGHFADARLIPLLSPTLDDKYTEIPVFIKEKVIPAVGEKMIPHLLADFDMTAKKKSHAMRLALLCKLKYSGASELIETVLNSSESSSEVTAQATELLDDESALLEMLGAKKQEVREAALCALIRIDSAVGKEKLIETLQSEKYKTGLKALSCCGDKSVTMKAAEIFKGVYNSGKSDAKRKALFDYNAVARLYDSAVFNCDAGEIYELFADYFNDNVFSVVGYNKDFLRKSVVLDDRWADLLIKKKLFRNAFQEYDAFSEKPRKKIWKAALKEVLESERNPWLIIDMLNKADDKQRKEIAKTAAAFIKKYEKSKSIFYTDLVKKALEERGIKT